MAAVGRMAAAGRMTGALPALHEKILLLCILIPSGSRPLTARKLMTQSARAWQQRHMKESLEHPDSNKACLLLFNQLLQMRQQCSSNHHLGQSH
ncbi:g5362 [Coccomyxa elongata]